MHPSYRFHQNLIVRTPYLPFEPAQLTEATLKTALSETWFQEAIFLASPDLYEMSMEWQRGTTFDAKKQAKLLASLTKYYSRMMSRCTPFGLFAACSVLPWGETTKPVTLPQAGYNRHTRFDMHFLCALAQQLATQPGIRQHLIYSPNTSIYTAGDEIRYIDYRYIDGQRSHHISAITTSAYIHKALDLAKSGITYNDLINALLDDDILLSEAQEFIDQLIDIQLLVHDLEPAITGPEFINQIITVIERIYTETTDESLTSLLNALRHCDAQLATLDTNRTNPIAAYENLINSLAVFGIPFQKNRLFQTDLFCTTKENPFDKRWQDSLYKAVTFLNRFTPARPQDNLSSFAQRFYERFEDKEMPLLAVLDNEMGIGYLDTTNTGSNPLIADLVLPTKPNHEQSIQWNKRQKWLFDKRSKAAETNAYTLTIDDSDLVDFPAENDKDLPPSTGIIFRIVDGGQAGKQLFLESMGSSSAINLLGRFAHGEPAVLDTVLDIAHTEQSKNPDVVFAEIVHLPESRLGNILLHPAFRPYEIPFLSKSSLPSENQIDLQDLVVSVRYGQILLRSKRLNKLVIPRLSTAHNYSYNALPVYEFLCDLQHQGKRTGFGFNWGSFAGQYSFLPRVSYQNVILQAATWQLVKADFAPILSEQPADIAQFTQRWQMPRFVVLADSDNELLVDWQSPLSIRAFIDTIKTRDRLELKEFLWDNSVQNEAGKPLIHQCISLLINEQEAYPINQTAFSMQGQAVQRHFSVGSEWLYVKLYGGVRLADKVLTEAIKPLTEALLAEGLIDKWFFIRYNDPQSHLRVRLHLTDTAHIGAVIQAIKSQLAPFEETGFIWKMQTDTYSRELERYGFDLIDQAESLFYHDSVATVDMLDQTWGDEREQIRWLWGVRAVDSLLNDFGLTLAQKHALAKTGKDSFAREFNMDIALKQQLNKKYRDNRAAITQILDRTQDPIQEIYPLLQLLDSKSAQQQAVVSEIVQAFAEQTVPIALTDLLGSYVHMLLNRLMPSNQRLNEFVTYDFLFRQYESAIARQGKVLNV